MKNKTILERLKNTRFYQALSKDSQDKLVSEWGSLSTDQLHAVSTFIDEIDSNEEFLKKLRPELVSSLKNKTSEN